MKGGNKSLHMVTFVLLAIGGLNWLLYGIFGWEIGKFVGGMDGTVAQVIYILVGLSAIYEIVMHKVHCKMCSGMMEKKAAPMGGSSMGGGSMGGGSSMGGSMDHKM